MRQPSLRRHTPRALDLRNLPSKRRTRTPSPPSQNQSLLPWEVNTIANNWVKMTQSTAIDTEVQWHRPPHLRLSSWTRIPKVLFASSARDISSAKLPCFQSICFLRRDRRRNRPHFHSINLVQMILLCKHDGGPRLRLVNLRSVLPAILYLPTPAVERPYPPSFRPPRGNNLKHFILFILAHFI